MTNLTQHRSNTTLVLMVVFGLAVFATQAAGAQSTFSLLYSFRGGPDGGHLLSGLIRDAAGNLYGTSQSSFGGTVFELDTSGTETVLHSFTGTPDGFDPVATLARDAAGNLYGTTFAGGPFNGGTIFSLDTAGTESVLYSFTGGSDGLNPFAGLVMDSAGNLYGTTSSGGHGSCSGGSGCGTVFEINTAGALTVLHTFKGGPSDGAEPFAGLAQDAVGNLYGTTVRGGTFGGGTVFKLDTTGTETVLYSFHRVPDGRFPAAVLVQDATGNLYGTTENGGAYGRGTIFKLDTTGTESVLYSFQGAPTDGAFPNAGLVRDAVGNLYGTTFGGGAYTRGTVFKLDITGTETVLHNFKGGPTDGINPEASLVQDPAGNLYGTTFKGGAHQSGTIFELSFP